MQVPNGTGPGVRRSKRPLLASRTRCNVLWKPPKFGNKVKIGNKVQFGNKCANWCNVRSIEGVIVYGHVPECHVTFGRGRLHNVWWDPHIDHKTSRGTIKSICDGCGMPTGDAYSPGHLVRPIWDLHLYMFYWSSQSFSQTCRYFPGPSTSNDLCTFPILLVSSYLAPFGFTPLPFSTISLLR